MVPNQRTNGHYRNKCMMDSKRHPLTFRDLDSDENIGENFEAFRVDNMLGEKFLNMFFISVV